MAFFTAKFIEKHQEAEGTVTYTVERPDGFDYQAGQYVVIKLPIPNAKPQDTLRTFSIAASPTEPALKFTMRHGPKPSLFKQAFWDLVSGTPIQLFGPTGTFLLHDDPKIPAVMIAGGIGIVPFRSMMKFVMDKHLPYRVTLLYSNPTESRVAFKQELDEWVKINPNINVVHTLTEPADEHWAGACGRIDTEMIKKITNNLHDPIYYICGTPEMVVCMETLLQEELNVNKDRIHYERFTGYSLPPTPANS